MEQKTLTDHKKNICNFLEQSISSQNRKNSRPLRNHVSSVCPILNCWIRSGREHAKFCRFISLLVCLSVDHANLPNFEVAFFDGLPAIRKGPADIWKKLKSGILQTSWGVIVHQICHISISPTLRTTQLSSWGGVRSIVIMKSS